MPRRTGVRKKRRQESSEDEDQQDPSSQTNHHSTTNPRASSSSTLSPGEVMEGNAITLRVSGAGGDRMDHWLCQALGISRSRVNRAAKAKMILMDGLAAKVTSSVDRLQGLTRASQASSKLREGQTITFREPDLPALTVRPEPIPLEVEFEDEYLLVVNKPAGMCVHPAGGLVSGTMVNALLHHFGHEEIDIRMPDSEELEELDPLEAERQVQAAKQGVVRPGIVHRLDRFTSGIMVVAKEPTVHADLHTQFGEHSTERVYEALLCGIPQPEQGTVEGNIGRDPCDRLRMAVVPEGKGKPAVTHYECVETFPEANVSRVAFTLETGRTHQIRVHASRLLQCPLLGDDVYGGAEAGGTGAGSSSKLLENARLVSSEVRASVGRQALHARTLGFTHPLTHERVTFEVAPPDDIAKTLDMLRHAHVAQTQLE